MKRSIFNCILNFEHQTTIAWLMFTFQIINAGLVSCYFMNNSLKLQTLEFSIFLNISFITNHDNVFYTFCIVLIIYWLSWKDQFPESNFVDSEVVKCCCLLIHGLKVQNRVGRTKKIVRNSQQLPTISNNSQKYKKK